MSTCLTVPVARRRPAFDESRIVALAAMAYLEVPIHDFRCAKEEEDEDDEDSRTTTRTIGTTTMRTTTTTTRTTMRMTSKTPNGRRWMTRRR